MNETAHHLCPHCHRETTWQDNPYRPFCSERCKMIDLGAWIAEEYTIPGEKKPAEEDSH
ncbi:DNA gyrase inhibitor YacG [Geotalea sp. SG265]|uniref:DNA gyrase inhibitor YacG n=1 Tax=Geotalea sp. SG265 TaxID=2922867 RepID=UPI001FAF54FB|nr:DNA gyrase inhibitor YacG [Geotalea sp. SG265]